MFVLMGLRTRMYMAYSSSMKSQKDALDKAMGAVHGADIDSVRLDRYHYSTPARASGFGGGACILPIPPSDIHRSGRTP